MVDIPNIRAAGLVTTEAEAALAEGQMAPKTGNADTGEIVNRTIPVPPPGRASLVNYWMLQLRRAKNYFYRDFERMREDQDFAIGKQWLKNGKFKHDDDRYVANVILRHVNQKTASLYARNPKVKAERKKQLLSTVWDGSMQTVMLAMQKFAQNPADMQAAQIIQDYNTVKEQQSMIDKIAQTLEIVYEQQIEEQQFNFKQGMKRMVRNAIVTGIGYAKLSFQRIMQLTPEAQQKINDYSQQLATIERLSADLADQKIDMDGPGAEQLKLAIEGLQRDQVVLREGLTIGYPESTSIIPDPKCRNIRGFVGADWVAEEYVLLPEYVQEIYGVDVGNSYIAYSSIDGVLNRQNGGLTQFNDKGSNETMSALFAGTQRDDRNRVFCVVWEIYNKKDGLVYTICDGYPDFLAEPSPPDVFTSRFWPWFSLTLNEASHYEKIFPPSDVRLMMDMQLEINRARQGLREHRIANRPKTAVAAGLLDDEDVAKLQTHPANAVIEMTGLQPGQKIEDLLQPFKMPGIDPNLYDVSPAFQDIERTVGVQEANLGGLSKGTATESSIAESSRMTQMASNIDDLTEMLEEMARTSGQILLGNLSLETVQQIAGPGAVWPEMSHEQIADLVFLKIEAGSTGRPNQALEIANAERLYPYLLQMPGVNPEFVTRDLLRRLDDRLPFEEAFSLGMPSIQAQNTMQSKAGGAGAQPGAAGREGDPAAQGNQGANNLPSTDGGQGGDMAVPPPKLQDFTAGNAV
jgi:hypothetical protein